MGRPCRQSLRGSQRGSTAVLGSEPFIQVPRSLGSIFAPVNVASQTSEHQRGDRWGRDINTLYKRKTVYITWT